MEEQKTCHFVPRRKDQTSCKNPVVISYGDKNYCKDHKRTVQALKERDNWSENEKNKIRETMETPDSESEEENKEPSEETPKEEDKITEVNTAFSNLNLKPPPQKMKDGDTPIKKKRISKNKWGRFEDPDTHIVFDPFTKQAYGYQNHASGTVQALTEENKRTCRKKGWEFLEIPVEEDDEDSEDDEYSSDSSDESD